MAIQPLNSEQQNIAIDNRINPFSNAQLINKLLNPEIKALIEQYFNLPLLLEKVIIQQNHGILITLKPNNSRVQEQNLPILIKLSSQLPSDLDKLIKQLESSGKISITITKNQQVQINISTPNQLKTSPPNLPVQSNLSVQPNQTLTLVFQKSEIAPSGQLILSQPIVLSQPTVTVSATTITPVNTLDLSKDIGKIASSLISMQSNPANKLSTEFLAIESSASQLKETLLTLINSSKVFNNYVKQIENMGTHKDIIFDMKDIEFVKTSSSELITNLKTINIQIQKLFERIDKPLALEKLTQQKTTENTKNLVSRLIKSGNLFENSLKQQTIKNDARPLNTSSKVPSDNKLVLNQLIVQLEKLLVEINRYTEKPITTNQIERIEKALLTQVENFTALEQHQIETGKKNVMQKLQAHQELLQNLIKINQSLQGNIKSSLQHIEQNQLHSLKSEQFNFQQFLVDLPIKQNGMIDSFEMRFESQNKKTNLVKNKYWKVVVRFDLEPLGPMFAEIQFENERLSTQLFAQEKKTANLINQHLPTLRKSLFSAGVNVKNVSGSQGNIPENLCGQDKPSIDTHA